MKKVLIINLTSIIVLIILLELVLNIFNLSSLMGVDSNLIEIEKGRHNFKKNSTGKIFGKKVYIDKNGFRVPKKNFKYLDDRSAIFFIGDSTAFGNGVGEEKTFIGKLRIKKNEFNFYNSSVIGYQISDHNRNIDLINKFPDIVKIFYVFTLNDVFEIQQLNEPNKNRENTSEKNFINKIKNIQFINYINIFLRSKSYTYMYVKGLISDPSKRYFSYVKKYYDEKSNYKEEINYFINLKNLTERKNIDLSVLILPYEFQTRKNQCNEKNLFPQKKIKDLLKSLKINYIDYTDSFCSHNEPKNLFYKFDPMHLSKSGHDLIFSLLQKKI